MRLLPSLLALVGLTAASATSKVAVYFAPPSSSSASTSSSVPSLTGSQAKLAVAHRLGLSRFHSISSEDDYVITLMSEKQNQKDAGEELFGSRKSSGHIVVQISGVAPATLFPDAPPVFVADEEAAEVVKDVLTSADGSWIGAGKSYTLNNYDAREAKMQHVKLYIAPAPAAVYLWSEESWNSFTNLVGDEAAAQFDSTNANHKMFALSYTELANAISKSSHFATAHSNGALVSITIPLLNLFTENSKEYATAVEILSDFFSNLSEHIAASTILLVSHSPRVHEHVSVSLAAAELKKRKEILISSHPVVPAPVSTITTTTTGVTASKDKPKKPTVPITRVPRFFDSKSKCETQTGQCSSRGKCIQSDYPTAGRWACQCSSSLEKTRSGKGTMRVYWAGNACQKQDISAPFHLFLVFTIIIVLAIVGAISTLYSMGGEELPGVLTAAQVHHKRQ